MDQKKADEGSIIEEVLEGPMHEVLESPQPLPESVEEAARAKRPRKRKRKPAAVMSTTHPSLTDIDVDIPEEEIDKADTSHFFLWHFTEWVIEKEKERKRKKNKLNVMLLLLAWTCCSCLRRIQN